MSQLRKCASLITSASLWWPRKAGQAWKGVCIWSPPPLIVSPPQLPSFSCSPPKPITIPFCPLLPCSSHPCPILPPVGLSAPVDLYWACTARSHFVAALQQPALMKHIFRLSTTYFAFKVCFQAFTFFMCQMNLLHVQCSKRGKCKTGHRTYG